MKLIDLTGKRFNRLLVKSQATKDRWGRARWWCDCDCGETLIVPGYFLRSGHTQSCGCLKKDRIREANATHGMSERRTYNIWVHIKQRCLNPKNRFYKDYGGRGITICDEWRDDFLAFVGYMGECPLGMTLDRYPDNNGNYEPGNCRWASRKDQANNRRSNRIIQFQGEILTLMQWAERLNIHVGTLHDRLETWSVEKALSTPVN